MSPAAGGSTWGALQLHAAHASSRVLVLATAAGDAGAAVEEAAGGDSVDAGYCAPTVMTTSRSIVRGCIGAESCQKRQSLYPPSSLVAITPVACSNAGNNHDD